MKLINFMKNRKANPAGRQSAAARRHGAFSAGMIALVIVLVAAVNVLVRLLPARFTSFDLSNSGIYTMTDTTERFLDALDKDVELVVLAAEDEVDSRISTFLRKFSALSGHLTVTWKDPTRYPSVLTEYGCEADSIQVICGERQANVPLSDILVMDSYYYYYYGETQYTSFDGEGQLLSAIDQVVRDVSHTVYLTTGHGESGLGTEVTELLTKNHFTTASVSLLMEGLPEECDVLILNQPTSDIAAEEREAISAYLAEGGQVEVILAQEDFDHPNLDALLEENGLAVAEGYIGDQSRYLQAMQSPLMFFPEIDTGSDAGSGLSSDSLALIYNSLGLTALEYEDESLTVEEFLTTSRDGIAVLDESSYEEGAYTVAATATRAYRAGGVPDTGEDGSEDASSSAVEPEEQEEGYTSRFTVYACATLLDDGLNQQYSGAIVNLQIFLNNLTAGFDDVSTVSVPAKSLAVTYNAPTNAGLWGLLYLAVIPLAAVALAFVRWWRRRKL